METVVRAVVQLKAVVDAPQSQFDTISQQVTSKLSDLLQSLESLPPSLRVLPLEISNYVNSPIYSLLQKEKLTDRQSEYVLRILWFLFNYCWRSNVLLPVAKQYISVCIYIVAPIEKDKTPAEAIRGSSVEVRTAGFNCLTAIIEAVATLQQSNALEGPQTQGLLVFTLEGIKNSQRSEDELAALRLLSCILHNIVGDVRPVLPNTASTLNNFIGGIYGFKHTEPKVTATNVLAYILSAAFRSPCDAQWAQNAAVQVEKMLKSMFKESLKTNSDLRDAFVDLAVTVSTSGWESLELCQPALLDLLLLSPKSMQLLADPRYSVAIHGKMLSFLDILPQVLTSQDAELSRIRINALRLYIKHMASQLFIDAFLDKLQESLPPLSQQSKDFRDDSPNATQITQLMKNPSEDKSMILLSDLKVKTGMDVEIESAVGELLDNIGDEFAQPVLDILLQQINESSGLAILHPLWIASCILRKSKPEVCEEYLQYAFNTINDLSVESTISPSVVALSCHLLGELALDPAMNFGAQLVDGLFPIVDLLGSDNTMVITQAKYTLAKIAESCGYRDVIELVLENKDYVLDGISIRLNTLNITPSTLNMLSVLITMTGNGIVVYLEDVITSLFIILDKYHGYTVLVDGIFSVFSAVVDAVQQHEFVAIKPKDESLISSIEDLVQELKKKPQIDPALNEPLPESETKKDEEAEPENDSDMDLERPMEYKEEWTSAYPKPIWDIVNQIFERCNVFLTHKYARLQAKILVVVSKCTPILATAHQFLPEIHKIWPSVSARVLEGEIFVCEAAVQVAAQFCKVSGEFMSSRLEVLWQDLQQTRPKDFYWRKWPEFSHEGRFIKSLCVSLSIALTYTRVDFATRAIAEHAEKY